MEKSASKTGKIRKNGKKKGKLGRKWEACRELAPAEGKGWLRPCVYIYHPPCSNLNYCTFQIIKLMSLFVILFIFAALGKTNSGEESVKKHRVWLQMSSRYVYLYQLLTLGRRALVLLSQSICAFSHISEILTVYFTN